MTLATGSFSYTGNAKSNPRDAVRLTIQDTSEDNAKFSDEEIDYFLYNNGDDVVGASIQALKALAARYAEMAAGAVGDMQQQLQSKSENYLKVARSLAAGLSEGEAEPVSLYAGGLDVESAFYRGVTYNSRNS